MRATCEKCSGTGETGHYGIIDCQAPGCTAADERAALEVAVDAAMPMTEYDQRWMAYQLGVKAERNRRHAQGYGAKPVDAPMPTLSLTSTPEELAERKRQVDAGEIPF